MFLWKLKMGQPSTGLNSGPDMFLASNSGKGEVQLNLETPLYQTTK